ncbi:MAG: hypothetical protein M5Z89_02065 [Olivibacter sp.]|nr:hypothetical protein [Olivibacter sp. UJ_SKK_5.1]
MHQLQLNIEGETESLNYKSFSDYKLKPYDGETGTTIQPVIKNYLQFDFIGGSKIESHQDVAQLMAVLESKSAEHFFVIHVNSDKQPLIQYLSTGNRDAVTVDKMNIHAIANYHNSTDLYLVHNHPSGHLTPSNADMALTKSVMDAYSYLNINVQSVIINTYKKEYSVIDLNGKFMNYPRVDTESSTVYKAITYHDMEYLREPIGKIRDSLDAFALIQQKRFSALPKYGVLVLSSHNDVVANFIIDNFDLKSIVKAVASVPNGVRVIGYGNRDIDEIKELSRRIQTFGVPLLDYIKFNSDSIGVREGYKSYGDQALLFEVQEKYGTKSVHDDQEINSTIKR